MSGSTIGSVACDIEDSRANILALVGDLRKDCHYVINDHVQGQLTSTKILLHAIDENTFSMAVKVLTPYDNIAWDGFYDIDTGIIFELRDNLGNVARGDGSEVSAFDWGNIVYRNVRVENSVLNVTYGATRQVSNVVIDNGSTVTLTGWSFGNISNSRFSSSTIDLTNARVYLADFNVVASTVNANGYTAGNAINRHNITNSGLLNISSSSSSYGVADVTLEGSSIIHSGVSSGSVVGSKLRLVNNCNIYHNNGAGTCSLTNSTLDGGVGVTHSSATLTFTNVFATSLAVIEKTQGTGAFNAYRTAFNSSPNIRHYGDANMSFTNSEIAYTANVLMEAGSTCVMNFLSSYVAQSSRVYSYASSQGSLSLTTTNVLGQAYIYKYGTGTLSFGSSFLQNNPTLTHNGVGNLNFSSSTLTNQSILNHNTTGVSSDVVTDVHIHGRGGVNFLTSNTGVNRLQYMTISDFGYVGFTGTTTGCNIERTNVNSASRLTITNSQASCTLRYGSFTSYGQLTISTSTAGNSLSLYYLDVRANGRYNITAPTANYTGYHTSIGSNGTLSVSGSATLGRYINIYNTGRYNLNGGSSTRVWVAQNALTSGNFTHSRIYYNYHGTQTLTANNTNTGRDYFNNTLV